MLFDKNYEMSHSAEELESLYCAFISGSEDVTVLGPNGQPCKARDYISMCLRVAFLRAYERAR